MARAFICTLFTLCFSLLGFHTFGTDVSNTLHPSVSTRTYAAHIKRDIFSADRILNTAPGITVTPIDHGFSVCEGFASSIENTQQFTVAGDGLSGDIMVLAPLGFEVSINPGSGYLSNLSLKQTNGIVGNTTIYIKTIKTTPDHIKGDVSITSPGVANRTVTVDWIINPLPTVNKVNDQTVSNGDVINPVNFTGTANTFSWVNNTPAIGLPASGTGDILPFKAINKGSTAITASITVTPLSLGYAYIGNNGESSVSIINLGTNTVVKTIAVGRAPTGVAISPDESRAYITSDSADGSVSVINTATNEVIATIPVDAYAAGIALTPDGKYAYVTSTLPSSVSVINTATNAVVAVIKGVSGPFYIAIDPDGNKAYVANGYTPSVSVIDIKTNKITATLQVGSAFGIAISNDNKKLYVTNYNQATVTVFNVPDYTVAAIIPVGTAPSGIAISSDNKRVYVSDFTAANVSVIDAENNIVAAIIPVGNQPTGVAISKNGDFVYVSNYGSNNVSVIDALTNKVINNIAVGLGPVSYNNFITNGTGCSGTPITFKITVKPTPLPSITVAGALSALTTIYGNASLSTSFTVAGVNMQDGLLITPPAGFELSVDNKTFANTLTIGTPGTIAPTTIYIRLKEEDAVGNYNGNITLTSTGGPAAIIATALSSVQPAPLVINIKNVSKTYGTELISSIITNFTSTGLQNNESIGSLLANYGPGSSAASTVATYTASVGGSGYSGGTFTASNYKITIINGDIIVMPAPLTISADDKSKVAGAENPIFTFSCTGFMNQEGPQNLATQPQPSTTATILSPAGSYPITFNGAVASNYTITYLPGRLTVTDAAAAEIKIPNTFTPNADGVNDTWDIAALKNYPQCNLSVFNRYGGLVYYSLGYLNPWNGTHNGKALPIGTYYYIIIPQKDAAIMSGPVTILR